MSSEGRNHQRRLRIPQTDLYSSPRFPPNTSRRPRPLWNRFVKSSPRLESQSQAYTATYVALLIYVELVRCGRCWKCSRTQGGVRILQGTLFHRGSRPSPQPSRAVRGILRVRVATVCAGSFGSDVEDLLTGPLMVFLPKSALLPLFASSPLAASHRSLASTGPLSQNRRENTIPGRSCFFAEGHFRGDVGRGRRSSSQSTDAPGTYSCCAKRFRRVGDP